MTFSPWRVLLGWSLCLMLRPDAFGQASQQSPNLVLNGGFEEDNDNLRGERMSCPVRARVTYGQRDNLPDHWTYTSAHVQKVRESHSGAYALRILPANK